MPNIISPSTDTNIIRSWVELYSDSLFSWAYYKISSKEIAEDLVQETFMVAVQSLSKYEGKSNPKTWLFAILKNKITDHFRKVYKNPISSEHLKNEEIEKFYFNPSFESDGHWKKGQLPNAWVEEPENMLDNEDFRKVLHYCLMNLPNHWFSAIQLKYIEEKNGDIICQELQISPTNFWQILHRAKLQLRKCLEINWFIK